MGTNTHVTAIAASSSGLHGSTHPRTAIDTHEASPRSSSEFSTDSTSCTRPSGVTLNASASFPFKLGFRMSPFS
jgi:hypothetical protein